MLLPKKIARSLLYASAVSMANLHAESAFFVPGSFGSFEWEDTDLWRVPVFNGRFNAAGLPPISNQPPSSAPGIGGPPGQIAYFIRFERVPSSVPLGMTHVTADTPLVLQEINIDWGRVGGPGVILPVDLLMGFNKGITFKGIPTNNQASLIITRGNVNIINSILTLESPLTIKSNQMTANRGFLNINGGIGGNQNLIIATTPQVPITINGSNPDFNGELIVKSGVVHLNSINPAFRAFTMTGGRTETLAGNQFVPNASLNVSGGTLDLGLTFSQIQSLSISGTGLAINANRGSVINGAQMVYTGNTIFLNGGTLDVNRIVFPATISGETGTQPLNFTPTISSTFRHNINIGIIGGRSPITIQCDNPNGVLFEMTSNGVPLGVPYTVLCDNMTLIGGKLTKTGNALLGFEGINRVPALELMGGGIVVGRNASTSLTLSENFVINPHTFVGGGGSIIQSNAQGSVINGGLVRPGFINLPGTLTIQGNYVQRSTGTLSITNAASRLNVERGIAILAGTLRLELNRQNSNPITIITGQIFGDFANKVFDVRGPYVPVPIRNSTSYVIEFTNSPTTEVGAAIGNSYQQAAARTGNAQQQARNINARSAGGGTTASVSSPLLVAMAARGELSDLTANEIQHQIDTGRFWAKPSDKPATVYFIPTGSWGKERSFFSQLTTKFYSLGGLLGGDYAFDRVGVGAFTGYNWTKGKEDADAGNFHVNSWLGQAYASFLPLNNRNFFLDLFAGGSRNWYTFNRHDFSQVAVGKPKGWEYDGYAGVGYNFNVQKEWRITPSVGVQYIKTQIGQFQETGAGRDNLHIEQFKQHYLLSWVGLMFGGRLVRDRIILLPEVRGFWQHQFSSLSQCLQFSAPCLGYSERIQVFTGDRNYGTVGTEWQVLFGPGYRWIASAAYDYLWSRHFSVNNMYGKIGINF